MPIISMALGKGQINAQQKEKFIEQVTQTAAEITNIPTDSFIILVDELDGDNIGLGGVNLTKKLAARAQS